LTSRNFRVGISRPTLDLRMRQLCLLRGYRLQKVNKHFGIL